MQCNAMNNLAWLFHGNCKVASFPAQSRTLLPGRLQSRYFKPLLRLVLGKNLGRSPRSRTVRGIRFLTATLHVSGPRAVSWLAVLRKNQPHHTIGLLYDAQTKTMQSS